MKRVTRYKQDGTFESLANMNRGRYEHACGHFSRSDGSVVRFELCRQRMLIFPLTLSAGVCGGRWWGGLAWWLENLGIYRDPGEGRGQRLEAGGQPALGKRWSQRTGTGPWSVHCNW